MPELGHELTLAQVIDMAFDYRGYVTVVKVDGTEVLSYIFNRNSDVQEPYVQIFDEAGDGPFRISYSEIRNIKFTGKDLAAGKSWEAWAERREKQRASKTLGEPDTTSLV
ncbi:MAG: hypothetical protein HYY00_08630 [Chloroflexi bacterium]|nr:hypothetical protein [Chloroflexota bacterium]